MQLFDDSNRSLDDILRKTADIKSNFLKIKEFPKYLDERLREIRDKTYYGLRKVKDGISKYWPIIGGAAMAALPLYVRTSFMAGLYATRAYGGLVGRIVGYTLAGVGIAFFVLFTLSGIHGLIHPNNGHIQYIGSPDGYEAFVPNGTINYNGHIDPIGDLILPNGTILHNDVIWNGQYANTINQNHNIIVQLNNIWVTNNNSSVGVVDPLNGQQFKPMQDAVVIKGLIPIENITLNNQSYYAIVADKINSEYIAEFYTYQGWIPNFVVAMNTPGTKAELLPQLPGNTTVFLPVNSIIFYYPNETGTVAFETKLYQYGSDFIGGYLLKQPHGPIIPYGIIPHPSGLAFLKFTAPKQVYNPYS
jgi:hypothetical protein